MLTSYVDYHRGGIVNDDLRDALQYLTGRFERSVPRTVIGRDRGLLHIYIDSWYENSSGGIGGVIVS